MAAGNDDPGGSSPSELCTGYITVKCNGNGDFCVEIVIDLYLTLSLAQITLFVFLCYLYSSVLSKSVR